MSIPTSGFAALLVVVVLALTSCGGDDAAPATDAAGSATVQTVTQTATATATAAPEEASKTATKPATTEKTKTEPRTQPGASKTETPTASAQQPAGVCQSVEVGARDGDVDVTYARIKEARKVDCATATYIAAQWGSQQLGVDKALLPLDWECTKGNVCTKGSSRVAFELVRPG